MEQYVVHVPIIGNLGLTKDGVDIILNALLGTDEMKIEGTPHIELTRNYVGDPKGILDRKRYNPGNRNISYTISVCDFKNDILPDRQEFAVTFSLVMQNGIAVGGNIIKVSDPGYIRNPYSKKITRASSEKFLSIYDIKKGGNLKFAEYLVENCLKIIKENTVSLPARP